MVQPQAPPPLILLAEDDPEMRRLLSASLRRRGYRVREAASGLELAERLFADFDSGEDLPHLVVSDERMPGLTGLSALRALRKRAFATPVVLITAWGDASLHEEARALGAEVLDKPFDLEDLHRLVASALSP